MKVEIWECYKIPDCVPPFVSTHVTPEFDVTKGRSSFLIAVDPNHSLLTKWNDINDRRRATGKLLTRSGFDTPKYIDSQDEPESQWDARCCDDPSHKHYQKYTVQHFMDFVNKAAG